MELVRGGALFLGLLAMGIMAGIFLLYSHTVMPGLARTDDRTFVGAFQALDRAILNPLFLSTFLGAFVFTGLATGLSVSGDARRLLPWLIVAMLAYLIVLIITFRISVPRNDALKEAGDPAQIADLAAVRQRFDEALWLRWNHVRSVASIVAFGALIWAAVLYGRITA